MGFIVRLFFVTQVPPFSMKKHFYTKQIPQYPIQGPLIVSSSEKTGRSPKDKRIVTTPEFIDDIWWGDVNIGIDEDTFLIVRERAIDYLNICDRLYITDGFAGWDPKYRICLLYTSPSPRDS